MRYLSAYEVLEIHECIIQQSGGKLGLRDIAALESAVAQPRMAFGGDDVYPTLVEKAAAMGYSLIQNHAFVDGNKRVGHAAMEIFLVLNGLRVDAGVDEQVDVVLKVATSQMNRESFTAWLRSRVVDLV